MILFYISRDLNMKQDYDFFGYFTPNITLYTLLGFWKPDEDMKFKKLYNCYTAFCSILCVAFLLSQMIYMGYNKQNVQEITATLCVTVTFTTDLIQMAFTYKKMNEIKALLKTLSRPLFQVKCQRHRVIAEDAKKLYTRTFNTCLYIGVQTDIFVMMTPFFTKTKMTTVRGWFPYDWTKPLNYILTYIFQNFVFVLNSLICVNTVMMTSAMLIQLGAQCDMLCCTLSSLEDFITEDGVLYEISMDDKLLLKKDKDIFSEAMVTNLVICIKHHTQIVRVAKDIERIYGTGIFILFLGGALILCSSLFQLSVVKIGSVESIMLLFYLISMICDQFMYCWFGNEVIYKSSLILESAYNTPWVDSDVKFRKILLQFMTRTCHPISILTGGLFTISVQVFISVVRTAYSYFTLLKTIE